MLNHWIHIHLRKPIRFWVSKSSIWGASFIHRNPWIWLLPLCCQLYCHHIIFKRKYSIFSGSSMLQLQDPGFPFKSFIHTWYECASSGCPWTLFGMCWCISGYWISAEAVKSTWGEQHSGDLIWAIKSLWAFCQKGLEPSKTLLAWETHCANAHASPSWIIWHVSSMANAGSSLCVVRYQELSFFFCLFCVK